MIRSAGQPLRTQLPSENFEKSLNPGRGRPKSAALEKNIFSRDLDPRHSRILFFSRDLGPREKYFVNLGLSSNPELILLAESTAVHFFSLEN